MNIQGNDAELVELLQNLIRIPSWVGENSDENRVVDFLEAWLLENTELEVIRQPLPGGRFNLIARRGQPDMVFLGHTDTVEPSEGAPYGAFNAKIHDEEIWGVGATDMKSGVAAMIQAISLVPDVNNLWLMLYADEEYDFLGMKHLVEDYGDIRPKIIISSDGSDLKFGFGCRGCIEFRLRVRGEPGHAAKGNGKSAIEIAMAALADLRKRLSVYDHPRMGPVSMNISHILGGTILPGGDSISADNLLVKVGQQGNKIPDVAEFVVDIRPPSDQLNRETALGIIMSNIEKQGGKAEVVRRTHDLPFWYTDPDSLGRYIDIAKSVTGQRRIPFDNPAAGGYLDLQMLWDATGRPAAFMFGGGNGNTAHGPNERIAIPALIKTRNFFQEVLKDYQSG